MDISIFLAKAFSLYFIIVGLALIIRKIRFKLAFKEILDSKSYILFIAILATILGILMVISHPDFTKDWRSVITVLAWLTLLKGIAHLFIPEAVTSYKRKILSHYRTYYIVGIICILLGLYLGYYGFGIVLL